MNLSTFKRNVWEYYKKEGRHNLPWRTHPTPYHVLVSEVMLQQTQVDRVIPKYRSFIKRFPSFQALAQAPLHSVLKEWQGLGYNRRALNLKRTAESISKRYRGRLPRDEEVLRQLPGIGPYTAGAICAFAFNIPSVFIETNIRSVFIHTFYPKHSTVSDKDLIPHIRASLDTRRPREWYYALMDYGTHLKATTRNPGRKSSHYNRQSTFKGSNRELRGKILKALLTGPQQLTTLAKKLRTPRKKVLATLTELTRDGFIQKKHQTFSIRK